jgi:two-component system cell cycle sensor histidine kinase PleC
MRVMSVRAEEKKLLCRADISTDLKLRADRRAVKQILLNLISNAIKFTPDGGQIAVHAKSSGNCAFVVIEDSGIGIAKDALKKLGRPFEQVESQLTKTYHGSGLGLAIAKSLAGLHGGSMKLRSKLGVGTIVCVMLPLDPAGREASRPPAAVSASHRPPSRRPRALRSGSPARALQEPKSPARPRPASARAEDLPPLFPA